MPKQRVYGTPLGTEKPSSDVGRPKKKDSDPALVRQALTKVALAPAPEKLGPKARGSSSENFLRRRKPPAILDAEIEKQSR